MSADTSNAINYNFETPAVASRYLRAFLAYVKAMENLHYDDIIACFDDSLVHRTLPASLGLPMRSKEAYADFFKDVPPVFAGNKFNLTIHEVIESGHTIVVHCSSSCLSAKGTPYANEHSIFIHFVPLPASIDPATPLAEGEMLPKMALVKEFMDSGLFSKFFAEEGAAATVVEKGA